MLCILDAISTVILHNDNVIAHEEFQEVCSWQIMELIYGCISHKLWGPFAVTEMQ